ncbi:MAG: LPS assembly lipoprotein LptE [Gemmatimonadales bacterium]
MRLTSGFLASLSPLILGGCLYGFAGGGLPPSIRTVAVLPFDNQTPEPTLTQEISRAVREAVEQRLGLRQASESRADAVVRGSITSYDPDLPVAYSADEDREVNVTRRQVQITVSVEILDQKQGRALWQRNGLVVRGDYETGSEIEGRRKALDDLVVNIVEGAQSQW